VKTRLDSWRAIAGFISLGIAGVFDGIGHTLIPKDWKR
jgi:hypothetical protein